MTLEAIFASILLISPWFLVDIFWLNHHWLVVWTPLKNISQLGWLFPIYGKIKNVPNHQPDHIHPSQKHVIIRPHGDDSPETVLSFQWRHDVKSWQTKIHQINKEMEHGVLQFRRNLSGIFCAFPSGNQLSKSLCFFFFCYVCDDIHDFFFFRFLIEHAFFQAEVPRYLHRFAQQRGYPDVYIECPVFVGLKHVAGPGDLPSCSDKPIWLVVSRHPSEKYDFVNWED